MTVELKHAIAPTRDPQASAQFLAEALGLTVDPPVAHFTPVTPANKVSLDYDQMDVFEPHHYAFMAGERELDAALARLQHGGITHYDDPACRETGQIFRSKRTEDRRGTWFHDPDGHPMEILPPGQHRVVRPTAAQGTRLRWWWRDRVRDRGRCGDARSVTPVPVISHVSGRPATAAAEP
ncbi:hypothetical protein ACGF4C_24265 [Streptomyces sp. NPDC048197]|uniref:hypothetical protein n=1 Tax=Streptomyces sp. NPDC048197 TaxID=3365511 RepID=UPI0037238326